MIFFQFRKIYLFHTHGGGVSYVFFLESLGILNLLISYFFRPWPIESQFSPSSRYLQSLFLFLHFLIRKAAWWFHGFTYFGYDTTSQWYTSYVKLLSIKKKSTLFVKAPFLYQDTIKFCIQLINLVKTL